jgi:hypothetical protein
MRNLVEPPPSLRCELCHGELRFKRIEPDDPLIDMVVEIFVCVECGRAHSRWMNRDPYAAHTARSMPHGKMGQPAGAGSNRYA